VVGTLSHLVTGATGFVGRALVLELLTRTDRDVVCLVRSADSLEQPHERLHRSLAEAAVAYGVDDSLRAAIARRCRAVTADLHAPLDEVAATLIGQVDQVWHCAASLRYLERDRKEIERTNVHGTDRMLRFAATVGANAFHYVSTAYVVGDADGHLPERPLGTAASNNAYEETKLAAEALVLREAVPWLRVTILRPSVVVGHSVTSAV
jgi:thioester reductase-like protein